MKVSNHFELPVCCLITDSFGGGDFIDNDCIVFKGYRELSTQMAECVDMAINNHDRLESENKRLREFVTKLSRLGIDGVHFTTKDDVEFSIQYFSSYTCTDIIDDANVLLESLEGGKDE